MSIKERLLEGWAQHGLGAQHQWQPTFIEDVGSASAENVRSAALRRLMNNHPRQTSAWLQKFAGVDIVADALKANREVHRRNCRFDLTVGDGVNTVFLEMKWASAPNDAQLSRYRDEIGPVAPLLLISPVRHPNGQGCNHCAATALDWFDVLTLVESAQGPMGSVEHDLLATLRRWTTLVDVVRDACRTPTTAIAEFRELIEWVDEQSGVGSLAFRDYSILTRQLVLAELADALAVDVEGWRRCLTNRGASGDFQADLCREASGDFCLPCPSDSSHGLATVLRFHAYPDFQSIDLIVGTMVTPYFMGAERLAWKTEDPLRAAAVFKHAAAVRTQLWDALDRGQLTPSGRPTTEEWWKCAYCRAFDGEQTVADLQTLARQAAAVLQEMPWCSDVLHN